MGMNRIVILLASVVSGTKGAELPISVTQASKNNEGAQKNNLIHNTQSTNTEREDGKVTKEDQIEKADNTGGNTEEKDEKTL